MLGIIDNFRALDALRLQQDLSEKLKARREARLKKLEDKQNKEKASFLQKAEKSTNTTEFVTVRYYLSHEFVTISISLF